MTISDYMRVSLLTICLLTGFSDVLEGQCRIESLNGAEIVLEPVDEISLRILVTDAIISELSSPDQGICGVRLDFVHQDITDLNFTLISPAGDEVILLGPATPTGNSLQIFGVPHDILFVPSTEPANPDPGLEDRWDNRDPDWGDATAYAGNYYPFGGDLDINFATGPVEGIWELRLMDQFLGSVDPSSFRGFDLIFCDDQITCNACESLSGTFLQDSLTLCGGQDFSLSSVYTVDNFEPDQYIDIPVAFDGDDLISVGAAPTVLGTYDVYVLNVLASQEQDVLDSLATSTREEILDLIDNPGGTLCLSRTDMPLILIVSGSSAIDAVIDADSDFLSCRIPTVTLNSSNSTISGSTQFSWIDGSGEVLSQDDFLIVDQSGFYGLLLDDGMCTDSTSIRILEMSDSLEVSITSITDTLSCNNPFISLGFNADFTPSSVTWMDISGDLLDSMDSLRVERSGTIILAVEDSACVITDTINIGIDTMRPDLMVMNDTINCTNPTATLRVLNPDMEVRYEWMQNDAVIGMDDTLVVNQGGPYEVFAIASNGCSNSQLIMVPEDMQTEMINLPADTTINCFNPTLLLSPGLTGTAIINQSINGGPFTVVGPEIDIDQGGQYNFRVDFDNGCTDIHVINVDDQVSPPEVLPVVMDTLTCAADSVVVRSILDPDIHTFLWVSVDTADVPLQVVRTDGQLTLFSENLVTGCSTIEDFIVISDREEPTAAIMGDSIVSCMDSIITLTAVVSESDAVVTWTAPDGAITAALSITDSQVGEYQYEVIGANGCDITGSISVTTDQTIPTTDVPMEVVLDCNQPVSSLEFDPALFSDAFWTIGGDVIRDPQIIVDSAGVVQLDVANANGCTNQYIIDVIDNQIGPAVSIANEDSLFCSEQTLFISATDIDPQADISYEWSLNAQLVSQEAEFISRGFGIYTLIATDVNSGCFTTDSVAILITDNPINSVLIDIQDESCIGDNNGAIDILMIEGGMAPFSFFIGDSAVQQNIGDLMPDEYVISIIDAAECRVDTLIDVSAGEDISVVLPPDMRLDQAVSLDIDAVITGDVATIEWFINGSSVSTDVESINTIIDSDQEIVIQVISNNGCIRSDTLLIDAIIDLEAIDFFIPNGFVPSSGGPNSTYYLSLPDNIVAVDRFEIYDRWGNQVANVINPPGRERVEIWNGLYQNELVNSGVFVYFCEVTSIVGNQKITYSGTITVVN
jgi:hypothetical protein